MRHCAFLGAVLLVILGRPRWGSGTAALLIIATLGILNVVGGRLRRDAWLHRAAGVLSPFVVLTGWIAIAHLTGGVRSPFVVGIWLELVLVLVTGTRYPLWLLPAFAVLGLAVQESPTRLGASWTILALQAGFIAITALALGSLQSSLSASRGEAADLKRELMDRLGDIEEEIRAAQVVDRVGERAARVAHGLVNSVHSLRGFTSLLAEDPTDVERVRPVLGGIERVTESLERLVELTLSGRERPPDAAPRCGIDDVIEASCDEIRGSFPRLVFRRHLECDDPRMGAPEAFQDVLGVLLRNAAEAMNGTGVVDIVVKPRGGDLLLQVGDQGPGVPDELESCLFAMPITTKETGHGLGLYLVRRQLEAAGGCLEIDSTGPSGTVFSACLPLRSEALS